MYNKRFKIQAESFFQFIEESEWIRINKISIIANSLSLLIGSVTLYLTLRAQHTWYILPFVILDILQLFFLLPILPGRAPLLKITTRPSAIIVAFLNANFWVLWNAGTFSFQPLPMYHAGPIVTGFGFNLYVWGFILSAWGILTLRLSFSVLPEKRNLIQTGPYRFVHHPIYLGYTLMTLGQSLASGYLMLWIGTLLNSLLFLWRASKETEILNSN